MENKVVFEKRAEVIKSLRASRETALGIANDTSLDEYARKQAARYMQAFDHQIARMVAMGDRTVPELIRDGFYGEDMRG